MGFIFVTLFLDVLGFGILIPVAPELVKTLLAKVDPAMGTEAAAAPYYGWLVSTYAIMTFFFAPVLGALSDRFGRRPVLLFSILGSGLDYLAMALAPSLWILYLTRMFNGITGASMTVCNAYIADVTRPDERAKAYGMVGAAFGLGFIVGPLLGGILGGHNLRLPFYVAGGLALTNWLYGYFVLPESLKPENRSHLKLSRMNPIAVFRGLREHPLVRSMAGSLFMLNLAMFGLHSTWALYTGHRYGWDKTHIGLSLAVVGLGAAVVQGGLARKLIPALGKGVIGERRALLLGILIGVLAYVGYGAAPAGWMIYAVIGLASLGGIAQPAGTALITRSVRADEQGAVQGAITGLQSIAQIIAPLIATRIFAAANPPVGTTTNFSGHPGLSFYYCAVLALVGLVLAWWATRNVGKEPRPASA